MGRVYVDFTIIAPMEWTMYLRLSRKYYVAAVSSKRPSKIFERQEILRTGMGHTICLLIIPIWLKRLQKKTSFFWVSRIFKEIKDLSNNGRKPSERNRFVDEQTRIKWNYSWHVLSHLSFFYYFVNVYLEKGNESSR